MKAFIRLILGIGIGAMILVATLRLFTKRIYGTGEINQTNLNWFSQQKDTIDYLFVGSSYCYAAVNTPLFDSLTRKQSFNLGYATAGPVLVSLILKKADLSKIKNIFWITSPADIISTTDNSEAYPYFLFNNFDDLGYYLKGYLDLRDLHNIFQRRIKYFLFYPHTEIIGRRRGSKGEVYSSTVNPAGNALEFKNVNSSRKANPDKLDLLEKIVSSDTKIGLVIYPYGKFASGFSGNVLKEYQAGISRLSNSGTKVIDLRDRDGLLSNEDWRDFDHLNSAGAEKITRIIADHVRRNDLHQ